MLKILAIEDDHKDLILLRAKLAGDFEVYEARSLTEARRVMANRSFDAILLDVGLRDSDRHSLVEEVKKEAKGAAIIILSDYQDTEFMREAIAKSASEYLVKGRDDVNGASLVEHIRKSITFSLQINQLDARIAEVKKDGPKVVVLPWLVPVAVAAVAMTAMAANFDPGMKSLFAIDRWIESIANQ